MKIGPIEIKSVSATDLNSRQKSTNANEAKTTETN